MLRSRVRLPLLAFVRLTHADMSARPVLGPRAGARAVVLRRPPRSLQKLQSQDGRQLVCEGRAQREVVKVMPTPSGAQTDNELNKDDFIRRYSQTKTAANGGRLLE